MNCREVLGNVKILWLHTGQLTCLLEETVLLQDITLMLKGKQNANAGGITAQSIRQWCTVCCRQINSTKTNSARWEWEANKWMESRSKVALKRRSAKRKSRVTWAGCGAWQVEWEVAGCFCPAVCLKQSRALTRIPSITQSVTSVTWQAKPFPVKAEKCEKRARVGVS